MIGDVYSGPKQGPNNHSWVRQSQATAHPQPDPVSKQTELEPDEAVNLSPEISNEFNDRQEINGHQGLESLMSNLISAHISKPIEATEQVQKVDKAQTTGKITGNRPEAHGVNSLKQVDETKEAKDHHKEYSNNKSQDKKSTTNSGNLKASSSKEIRNNKKPNSLPSAEQTFSHGKPGSKSAPKTGAPYPVGSTEAMKAAKPDTRVGIRKLPQIRNSKASDRVDFSDEIQQQLAQAQ